MLGNKKKYLCRVKLRKDVWSRVLKSVFKLYFKNKRGIWKDIGLVEFFLFFIFD